MSSNYLLLQCIEYIVAHLSLNVILTSDLLSFTVFPSNSMNWPNWTPLLPDFFTYFDFFSSTFPQPQPSPPPRCGPNWCVQCSSPAVSSSSNSPPALRLSPYLGYSLLSVATLVAFRFNSLRLIVILIPFTGQAQHCSIIFLSLCISFSIFALLSFTSLTFLQMRPGNFVFYFPAHLLKFDPGFG